MRLPGAPEPREVPQVVATIGNFDGVHLGHRALLDVVRRRAFERGLESAVVTFDPHPRLVLRPDEPLNLISTLDEKLALFDELRIDRVLVWRFDEALRSMDAAQFLDALGRYVTLRRLVHGPGFALGRARQGTVQTLSEIGRTRGFTLEQVELHVAPGEAEPVTSTAIRQDIEAGRVHRASRALGRPPTVSGTVVEGERIGRTLGFPTANLRLDGPLAIPADGVYVAWAELNPFTARASRHAAAVSVGERPTFDGKRRVVEAYLLDYEGDLYGQQLRLHFLARLRGQERFETEAALIDQMRRDVALVRRMLVEDRQGELAAADG